MKKTIFTLILFGISIMTFGQDPPNQTLLEAISELDTKFNKEYELDKKDKVQLGISFAYGELSQDDTYRFKLPTIDPLTKSLRFQQLDGQFILVSATMTVTPFLGASWITENKMKIDDSTKCKNWKKLGLWIAENSGIAININFLEIAPGNSKQKFNQIVEGGIGMSFRLSKNIYYSFSRELKFHTALNDAFVEGEPIYLDGQMITSIDQLDTSEQDYYHNKTLQHWSSRIIVNF